MKTTRWIGFLVIMFLFAVLPAFAGDVAASPVAAKGDSAGLLLALIPVLVPLIVAVGKWALPKVPTWILPILAPALGALVDYLTTLAAGTIANPILGAALGSAGVGVRELFDQVKGRLAEGPAAKLPLLLLCVALPVASLSTGVTGCAAFSNTPAVTVRYFTLLDSWTLTKAAYDSWSERVVSGKVSQEDEAKVDAGWNKYRDSFQVAIKLARQDWNSPSPGDLTKIQNELLLLIQTLSK